MQQEHWIADRAMLQRLLQRLCCKKAGGMVNSAVFKKSRGVFLMTKQSTFKWRHFEAEIILLCVRWYLRVRRVTLPSIPS